MKSFLKALELCDRIAEVAEAEGHHPDVHVTGWNRLAVELWTHSRHGLTEVRKARGCQELACHLLTPHAFTMKHLFILMALPQNDYIMAAKIDAIPKDDLLGGKKKKFADI